MGSIHLKVSPEDWVDMNGNLVGRGKKGRFSTGGSLPKVEGVQFMKGWFTNTLPDYLKRGAANCAITYRFRLIQFR